MPINWLSNLEFSKENPYKWNTKDLKTKQNEIRELDRKRAIERSVANGIDSNGVFSESALRSNLIKEGFGEDADRIINEVTSNRQKKVGESLDLKERATNLYTQGIIDKDEYDRLVGNEKKITEVPQEKEVSQTSPETDWQDPTKDPESWKSKISEHTQNKPQEKENEILVQATPTSQNKQTAASAFDKFREKKVENVPSQFTPKYATFGSDVDVEKYMGKPTGSKKERSFEVASDKQIASRQTRAAETVLGFSIDPKKDISTQISDKIATVAEENTKEPIRAAYKERSDYLKAVSEWESKIKENEQKLIEGIQAQSNALYDQGIKGEQLNIEKAKVFHPDFSIPMEAAAKDKMTNITAAIKGIDSILEEFKSGKYPPNSPGYEGLKLALAKEMIIAYDLPVGEGTLNEVKQRINTGRDWWDLIPNAPKDFIEKAKSLRKDMSTEDAIKLGQGAQKYARNKYIGYKPKDMKSFNKEFHIYGEEPKSGAVQQLEAKKTPEKPTGRSGKTLAEIQAERGKK